MFECGVIFAQPVPFREHERKLLPQNLWRVAHRKLTVLNHATQISDVSVPPANRLEKLKGKRAGQHSIRINDQYRICFRWTENGINEIVKCGRPVTLDTAFRLARYFGTSPGLWTNMQTAWDLWHFQRSKDFKGIQKIEPAREMVEV